LLLGCFLGLTHVPANVDREALRSANDLYPLDAREFEARFRGREDLLALGMGPNYAQALQQKGLAPPAAGEWPRLVMSPRMIGSTPGQWDRVLQYGGLAGLLALPAAFGVLVGWRPLGRLITLAGPVFLPLFLLQLPILFFNKPEFRSRVVESNRYPSDVEGVQEALLAWAPGEKYGVQVTSAWYLHPPARAADVVGKVAVFHLRRTPITARWKLRPGTLQQTGPDLLVVCADCNTPKLVTVQVNPLRFDTGPESRIEHDAFAEGLMRYLDDHVPQLVRP
jgi:hypothetical protein